MQQMALSWLIYRLSNSALMLGVVGFASQAPSLLLTPFAGILADRANRHRILIITQTLAMVQAGILAALVLAGHIQLWQVVTLSAALGVISAFDMPIRQSFIIDMLDSSEQLQSAIGINSSIVTMTRLIGPFAAGLFVAWAGEGMCFLINAVSYIAVIIALLFVRSKQTAGSNKDLNAIGQLKEGFAYTFGFAPIRDLIILLALVGLVSMPFAVLMPAFAKDVFHGNASTLGFLTGASGVGSVLGAVLLTSGRGVEQLGRWIIGGCGLFGLALIAFGLSHTLLLSLPLLALVGFGSMLVMAGSNSLIQTIVDADKRGRVMSIFIMAFMGLSPFGCMAGGALANIIGVGNTVIITGIFTVTLALVFASRVMRIHQLVTPLNVELAVVEAETEMKVMNT
jgi:MFS family permease